MKNKLLNLLLLVLVFAGCYPSIDGTVVDAETGLPIEGAVVLVEWTKTHGVGEHWTESYKVAEVLTDKDGKFTLPGCYNPFVNEPDLTIYKKGYVAWSSRWIFPENQNRAGFKLATRTYKMNRFKKEYSYVSHVMFIRLSINESINSESKTLIEKAFDWETDVARMER